MSFWRRDIIQPALNADLDAEIKAQHAIIAREPANARPHYALGTLLHLRGETDRAVTYFLKAIELDPAYAAPRASLGRISAVQGDYDAAWRHAREAERLGDRSLVEQLERYRRVRP